MSSEAECLHKMFQLIQKWKVQVALSECYRSIEWTRESNFDKSFQPWSSSCSSYQHCHQKYIGFGRKSQNRQGVQYRRHHDLLQDREVRQQQQQQQQVQAEGSSLGIGSKSFTTHSIQRRYTKYQIPNTQHPEDMGYQFSCTCVWVLLPQFEKISRGMEDS